MEPKDYIISKIEGEYAYLHDLSNKVDEDIFIALFLLPDGVDVGTKLHYEMMEYTIIE
ncbi:MAG: hypothetical protein IJ946_02135 [Clostridia bacterium]|nr:hypothetical protein [Clostridia bacterium]